MTAPLTAERLFGSPALTGSPPRDLKFSPDGSFVTFRAPAADDQTRYNLHRINLPGGDSELWIDAAQWSQAAFDVTDLTPAERAERERRRDFSHGVTQYLWRPHSDQLLLPVDGQPRLFNTLSGEFAQRACAPPATRQTSFSFSPDGNLLAYVRDGDLYLWDLAGATEIAVTDSAAEFITNGLPDFLAAEEMHRFEGYWWRTDNLGLFYCHVDERDVATSYRLEVDSTGARTVAQKYPYAGERNPRVELWHYHLGSQQHTRLWSNADNDHYLARVNCVSDGVVVQTQDRAQQQLQYRYMATHADGISGEWRDVFRQDSTSWVNLTDDFVELSQHRWLITDEQDGPRQLRMLDRNGNHRRIAGPSHVNQLHYADDNHALVSGWQLTPTENHLYRVDFDSGECRQITRTQGWHDISINAAGSHYIDNFSNPQTLLQISYTVFDDSTTPVLHSENLQDNHAYTPYLPVHSEAEFGELQADDGQTLHYRLTPPKPVHGKHPVILYVYGGPGAQKVRRDWGTLLVQLFAQQGFGVLEVDNRGSANRGRHFEAPLYRNMGTVEVADQVKAVGLLQQVSWADSDAVGVYGHSYGGYMTLMCLCQASSTFRAGAAVAPVCDWRLYDSHYTERFMATPETNPDGYRQGNVLSHLDALEAPLLLMHGMADDNVLLSNSTMIMDALQRLGKPFELMLYPGAKHSMQETHVSVHRFEMIIDFFRRTLTL